MAVLKFPSEPSPEEILENTKKIAKDIESIVIIYIDKNEELYRVSVGLSDAELFMLLHKTANSVNE